MSRRYTDVQHVRAAIGSQVSTAKDDLIDRLIDAVSEWIDKTCNRPDGFIAVETASARLYAGSGRGVQRIDECVAVTLVETRVSASGAFTAWSASDWTAFTGDDRTPNFNRLPHAALMCVGDYVVFPDGQLSAWARRGLGYNDSGGMALPNVRVTARWGYSATVPPAIVEACVMQVARQFARAQSGYSDATASAEFGVLTYHGLDPAVVAILEKGRFMRPMV